ncbi:MAG: LCP family protein [Clostridia bacterium]|nr:LCP family protein [Clostridia bacterium]
MKKISLFICFCILFSAILTSCAPATNNAVQGYDSKRYVYLVMGIDDAAKNTDVLFTMSYDSAAGAVRVAQIPRDTYYNFGRSQNKINQLYATKLSDGKGESEALGEVCREVSSAFGAKIDGYIGITIGTFKKIVDAIGGIDIEISEDMTLVLDSDEAPVVLKKGKNHIDGNIAEHFVRYRQGYAMGDLGRIDAQKIFLNALFGKILSGLTLPDMIKVINSFQKEVITDIKVADVISTFIEAVGNKDKKTAFYATVPGEPIISSGGLSYYVLNRKSAAEMAKNYMFADGEFDRERKFLNSAESGFINIYEDDGISLREYSNENVSDMHIISG